MEDTDTGPAHYVYKRKLAAFRGASVETTAPINIAAPTFAAVPATARVVDCLPAPALVLFN